MLAMINSTYSKFSDLLQSKISNKINNSMECDVSRFQFSEQWFGQTKVLAKYLDPSNSYYHWKSISMTLFIQEFSSDEKKTDTSLLGTGEIL
jgi:hypothetical protein